MKLYLRNWYNKLFDELPKTKKLRVISPFISEQIVRNIQSRFDFNSFELITRFNLRDFASNVSNLDSLKFAVESGAKVYGIRELHSKVYLFDDRAAIITSANLTRGGLINNFECGLFTTDNNILKELSNYFNELKNIGGQSLTIEKCKQWKQEISQVEIYNTKISSLPDYGSTKIYVDKDKSYYIKFFGTANNRKNLKFTVREEIEKALCHYSCGFSENKKPRQIMDGDIIYMARMTYDPYDYAIFGKAEALRFVDIRDRATKGEIAERTWKKDWPIYLRITNPVFIDGTLGDCILLYDLIKALDYDSFPTTRQRYDRGERDINPYKSLSQQAYVRLTQNAVEWLEPKFEETLNNIGHVDDSFLQQLPQTQTKIASWTK